MTRSPHSLPPRQPAQQPHGPPAKVGAVGRMRRPRPRFIEKQRKEQRKQPSGTQWDWDNRQPKRHPPPRGQRRHRADARRHDSRSPHAHRAYRNARIKGRAQQKSHRAAHSAQREQPQKPPCSNTRRQRSTRQPKAKQVGRQMGPTSMEKGVRDWLPPCPIGKRRRIQPKNTPQHPVKRKAPRARRQRKALHLALNEPNHQADGTKGRHRPTAIAEGLGV